MDPTPDQVDDAIAAIIEGDKSDRAKEKYTMSTSKKDMSGAKSPVHKLIDRISDRPGQYKTTAQVAEMLDTSESTLRRIAQREDKAGPSKFVNMGTLQVALYTSEDIKHLKKYLANQHRVLSSD